MACSAALFAACLVPRLDAKIITVNTTNNVSPAPGETTFIQAIQQLQDGDTIAFDIPGQGPFYIVTPPLSPDNGYPPITNNNVTIDGYTQPGASTNTNTILAPNNAQIQIVLDSRAGGRHLEVIPGYGDTESEVLLIKGATNVTIRGLDFLGPGTGSDTTSDPVTYAVSFALGASNGHVNGCWFGVGPDRTNVFRFNDAVTAFEGPSGTFPNGTVVGVEKSAPDALAARGQFNVIVGEYIPVILEGNNQRISGNFFNVFPDGVSDFNADGIGDHTLQAFIETGNGGDNLVIGTDGDGANDAEERNIFGGVTVADDFNLLEWYGCTSTNTVIAGNYFGVGVDGVTRFTNSMTVLGGLPGSATVRFGSDFDGVSDGIEGNVISMNYPFDTLFPSPAGTSPLDFSHVSSGSRISFRGNELLGAELMPFTYADGYGDNWGAFTNYYTNYVAAPIFPTLSTSSTQTFLRGTVAPGVAPYTNIVVDVYLADEEAWTNGQQFQYSELAYTDPATFQTKYYGFAEGRKWLASFVENGPSDLNRTPGQFAFDIGALHIPANTLVTATASYSADTPGSHNAVMHTSPFAPPVMLQIEPCLNITVSSTNIFLAWPTNDGLFSIQTESALNPRGWTNLNPEPVILVTGTNYQAKMFSSTRSEFFRLSR